MGFGWLAKIFSSGVMGTVETIATEFIQTDMEKAEAQTLLIKTLDPNGIMRRELSRFASFAYGYYLLVTSVLVLITAFMDSGNATTAAKMMTDLFLPITGAWTTIVSASFGVNALNAHKGV